MISSFQLVKLKNILSDFYTITGIKITVFDDSFHEICAYPENNAPLCQIIKQTQKGQNRCASCDTTGCKMAQSLRKYHIYKCHAGMTEAIAPIFAGNIIIGYLFFGQVFSYDSMQEGIDTIRTLCNDLFISGNQIETACKQMPLRHESYILSASHILEAVSSYLCLEQMFSIKQQTLPTQIDAYIRNNFHKPLTATHIAKHFHIGKTKLYQIFQESFGIGLAEYIRKIRIDYAKECLQNTPAIPLEDLAEKCGYCDYNYFITVFKKETGLSPRKYSRQ